MSMEADTAGKIGLITGSVALMRKFLNIVEVLAIGYERC
jgi:hypothetical protein